MKMAEVMSEEIDLALERILRDQTPFPGAKRAVYPLEFNDGFTPAVLEVSGGRQVVRHATPQELAEIF